MSLKQQQPLHQEDQLRPSPGYFIRNGKKYRSTALTLYVFTESSHSTGIFDSDSLTRKESDGHVPMSSAEGDRKELKKIVKGSEHSQWTLPTPPAFGVQLKMDIMPHYENGAFQFVQLLVSTILEDDYCRDGNLAPAIKLTIYTASDYFLWLNNLPFLRMLLNCAVRVTGEGMLKRSQQPAFRPNTFAPFKEEAVRLAGLVSNFLAADHRLPSLSAKPRKSLPAPQAFRNEYGSTIAEALQNTLKTLRKYPEFLSAIIAGCISCSNWSDYIGGGGARDGVGQTNYGLYYHTELPATRASRSAKVVEDENWRSGDEYDLPDDCLSDTESNTTSGRATPFSGQTSKPELVTGTQAETADTALNNRQRKIFSQTPGGAWQSSRIVIVASEYEWRVWPILMVCIFFFKRGRLLSASDPNKFSHLFTDVDDLLPSYIAGVTDSLATAYAIQWVQKERLSADDMAQLFDPRNDEGTILIIDALNESVTRYELENSFVDSSEQIINDKRYLSYATFATERKSALVLHCDETILRWVDDAEALAGTCAVDYYLQEQISRTYQRALLYEHLVKSSLLDSYDFMLGFVSTQQAAAPKRKGHSKVAPLITSSRRNHDNPKLRDLMKPEYDDVADDGASSVASSYGAKRHLNRRSSVMTNGDDDDDDDRLSTTSSIAPTPQGTMKDGLGAKAWMANALSHSTVEELFISENRLRVESLLGTDYTPSHGQLLHLMRFQQPLPPFAPQPMQLY